MRAARLLHMLLLLQNRGRMTAGRLAGELEVSRRTILRDLDAMTEAGLPVIVHRGRDGGIELGFDYRTRLTGLDAAEAEAMGVILSAPPMDRLAALGLGEAGRRAAAKIWEAFPDQTRATMTDARERFALMPVDEDPDPRLPALAQAVRKRRVVRLHAFRRGERVVHPVGLDLDAAGWVLRDGLSGETVPLADWGAVNISAKRFPG